MRSTSSDTIRRRKLHEEVAARLEDMIARGHFQVGDQLPSERELMERFGVGRPSIREALAALQNMGLVAISSGERARVTRPTPEVLVGQLSGAARHFLAQPDGVRHFQEARRLFEAGLARHAAEHAGADDLGQLKAALDANEAALGDLAEFERTDVGFHFVLAQIPRNPIFTALHHALGEWLIHQRTISLRVEGAALRAFDAHRRIFDAVSAHDADRAEREMLAHLTQVGELYWRSLKEEGPDGRLHHHR
jgi:GntR family transcriptional repressor for pyruvate dehydrogenase complex